jgi:L-Ala-D/L-Glu epimerase
MSDAVIHRLCLYHLGTHTNRIRVHESRLEEARESIVAQVETARGVTGWGEARVRPGLLGESADSITQAIEQVYLPLIAEFHPASFPEALEGIEALPWSDARDRPCPAARAVLELALIDCVLRVFHRDVDALVRWMGLPGFGSPGSLKLLRFASVIAERDKATVSKRLRRLYWSGVRSFKLSVGFEADFELVTAVAAYLEKAIRANRASLRLDAHGAWSKDRTIEWLTDAASLPIAAIEQPMPRGSEAELPILSDLFELPLAHDESVVTMEDAHRLNGLGVADIFHLAVDKCGGLIASLRLAAYARREGVRLSYGAGQDGTDILTAARARFLQVCPGVEWVDSDSPDDLAFRNILRSRLNFVSSVRSTAPQRPGLGVEIDPDKIRNSCTEPSVAYQL